MSDTELKEMAEGLTEGEYDAAIVIATDPDGSDIGAHINPTDTDPRHQSLWMVATHLWHVTRSARNAGGDITPQDVAVDAIKMLDDSVAGEREAADE